jgi:hypothetical protein
MTSRRIRFEATICCEADENQLLDAGEVVIKHLSERFGGASLVQANGGWTRDGNEVSNRYGQAILEPGIKIILSVLDVDEKFAYQELVSRISEAIRSHGLPAKFVHVERLTVDALHFDVSTHELLDCARNGQRADPCAETVTL